MAVRSRYHSPWLVENSSRRSQCMGMIESIQGRLAKPPRRSLPSQGPPKWFLTLYNAHFVCPIMHHGLRLMKPRHAFSHASPVFRLTSAGQRRPQIGRTPNESQSHNIWGYGFFAGTTLACIRRNEPRVWQREHGSTSHRRVAQRAMYKSLILSSCK